MAIVIYGPMASGKTYHASRFAQHYGCDRIVEADDSGRHIRILRDTDLVLTCREPGKAARQFPNAMLVPLNTARKAIGLEAAPDGGFRQPYDQAPGWNG